MSGRNIDGIGRRGLLKSVGGVGLVAVVGTASADTPSAPTELEVSRTTANSATLEWDEPAGADDYVVLVDREEHDGRIDVGSGTAIVHELEPDTSYEFGVAAVDADGDESNFALVTATTELVLAPMNTAGSAAGPTTAELGWGRRWDNPRRDYWQIYVDGEAWTTAPGSESEVVVESLEPETTHEIGVSAVADDGTESDVDTVTVTTPPEPIPVDNLTVGRVSSNSITLEWDEPSAATDYVVYADGEAYGGRVDVGSGTAIVHDLEPDTAYEIGIATVDEYGYESDVATVTATTELVLAPMNTAGSAAGPTTAELGWGRRWDNPRRDHWQVYVDDEAWTTVPGSESEAVVEGLEPETTHEIGVSAVADDGTESDVDTVTVTTPLGPPPGFGVSSTTSNSITLEWDDVVEVEEYVIYVDGEVYDGRVDVGSGTALVHELEPDTEYEVGIATVAEDGDESDVATVTATTELVLAPMNTAGSATGPTTAELGWGRRWDNPRRDHWQVYVDGETWSTVPGEESETTVEDLEPGTTYELGVSAVADDGTESDVDTVTVTTDEASEGPPPVGDNDEPPRDLNGDDLYRDLNGNGRLDSDDLVTYFRNFNEPEMQEYAKYYDYNGNGDVDFADLNDLFRQL